HSAAGEAPPKYAARSGNGSAPHPAWSAIPVFIPKETCRIFILGVFASRYKAGTVRCPFFPVREPEECRNCGKTSQNGRGSVVCRHTLTILLRTSRPRGGKPENRRPTIKNKQGCGETCGRRDFMVSDSHRCSLLAEPGAANGSNVD